MNKTAGTTTVPRQRRLACALAGALGVSITCGSASAQEEDLEALLDLLSEETELATRSKQNADYVPGMVSVLHAEDARMLGARTALDAIALVPGLDIQRNQFGAATIRVRSVDFFFNAGNVKVLVDGLSSSREAAFQSSAVLLMPIEQLERIEVIRGPGSGVHGDFAYMGLINLVTRHDGSSIGASAGNGSRITAYGSFRLDDAQRDFRFSGNLGDWRSDRYDTTNALANDERRSFLSLQAALGSWSAKMIAIDRDFSGLIPSATRPGQPPPPTPFSSDRQLERVFNVEVRHDWRGRENNRAAVWLQRQESDYERRLAAFEGPRTELGGDIVRGWSRHLLLLQAQISELGIDDANAPAPPGTTAARVNDRRRMFSLTAQNQFNLRDNLQLTAGLRWDRIEGIDSALTPRAAALWQITDRHLLKAQYAEGFRSPTYLESFSDGIQIGSIPFERTRVSELSYVFRTADSVFRFTGFSHHVSDMIFPLGTPARERKPEVEGQGLEFELTHRVREWLRLQATYSTANAYDGRTAIVGAPGQPPTGFGGPSFGQPEQLGNLALLFNRGEHWSAGVHWQHVGRRADRGTTGFQDGYNTLNLGASYRPAGLSGLRIDFGVRNLLEADVFYLESVGGGPPIRLNYPDRLWNVGLSWEFGRDED